MSELLTKTVLRGMSLPRPDENSDKEQRGRVLVIGSSARVPGASLLSGIAALRAGAGKLQLAVPSSLASGLGIALPESGIISLPETKDGELSSMGVQFLSQLAAGADAVLIGPGLMDSDGCAALVRNLLSQVATNYVLDAAALPHLLSMQEILLERPVILTPHFGEMASLLGISKKEVEANPEKAAWRVAQMFRCVVALKSATTFICDPDGHLWRNESGAAGLGTCGSGDVLAGIITGLLARGASPLSATLWGVFVHAQIGERLSNSVGTLGFLASEILPEIPKMLDRLAVV